MIWFVLGGHRYHDDDENKIKKQSYKAFLKVKLDNDDNKGIRDAGSTADFRLLFKLFEILEKNYFFWNI